MRSHVRTFLAAACALALLPGWAAAQGGATISGRVLNEAGQPLGNASVFIPGGFGAISKEDGRYSFTVPAARATGQQEVITARLIGYKASEARITLHPGTITQDFILASNPVVLQGVVVSAMGIEKPKSQMGTAAQQLNSDELNTTPSQNFIDMMGGKVSGAQITGSGTQGGSTNIILRGSNSITGNNNPLFIVDGVAVESNDRGGNPNGGGAQGGGYDFGGALSDINPQDIATLTVLKGPNAAALYGSRAANGVVIITTKHGGATDGHITTNATVSYTWDRPSILPTYQNLYGQGAGGQFQFVDGKGGGIQDGNDQSFGPRFDGKPRDQFTGPGMPWVAHPDNVYSFFNTGHTLDANLSASGGTDRASGRISVGAQNVNGYIPNNFFQKFTSALSGQLKVGDRFSTNASLNYIRNNGINRPGVGYNTGVLEQFIWFGRQVDMNALRAKQYNADGSLFNWNYNYHNNPFYLQYDNPERDSRDNFIGSITAQYKLTDWLTGAVEAGSNIQHNTQNNDYAAGNLNFDNQSYNGAFSLFNNNFNQNDISARLTGTGQVLPKLMLSALAGVSRNDRTYSSTQQSTSGISVPGIYNVSNAAISPTLNQYAEERLANSVFGSASFTWDGWWTVEGTARNDWSSTLPKANNSYFYPSVNTSIVLTDAIPSLKSDVLSYLKVRGSWAKVANDAPVYSLQTVYNGNSLKFGSLPQYSLSDVIANATLKPEITKSSEAGLEIGLFGDRVSIDGTYYDKRTSNQIFNVAVSNTTGFTAKSLNAGEISNKGWEGLVAITPIRTQSGFEWNTSFTYARNRSMVVSLYPGIQRLILGSSWGAYIEARAGQPYGNINGFPFARDSATGQILVDGGLPYQGERTNLGNVQPDWIGGWNNQFRYKNFSASVLVDIHEGGKIFSVSNMFGQYSGVFASTIPGREVDWNNPGIVVKGLDDQTGQANTVNVTAEQYYQNLFEIHEPFIYDDSYIKLREIRFGVDLPQRLAAQLHATAVSLAFVARNVWTHTNVPNIDPEFTYTNGNFQGIEFAALPNPKSFGFNISVTP